MAVSGPIARTMTDIELALHAMSSASALDPWHVPAPLQSGPFRKRAAVTIEPDGMSVASEVKSAITKAAQQLEAAGWEVEEVPCPPMRAAAEINACLWMAETSYAAADMIEREADPDASFVFDLMHREAGSVDMDAIMGALKQRAALVRQWEAFLQDYSVLICPVSGELPFDQQLRREVRSGLFARLRGSADPARFACYRRPRTFSGHGDSEWQASRRATGGQAGIARTF